MYRYIHDPPNRIVYKYPGEPNVRERTNARGRRTDWFVSMDVLITRADNKLNGNQWLHATSDHPNQYLGAQYTREQVVSFFMMRHAPRGEEISEAEYERLSNQYEAEARSK